MSEVTSTNVTVTWLIHWALSECTDAISTSFVAVLLMDDRDNSNNINEKSYLQTKRHTKSMKCWFGLIGGYNVFTIFSTILGLIKYNDNGSKALSIYLTQNLFGILVVVFTQITIFRFTVYPSSSSTITNSDDNLLLKNHQHSANPEKVSIIIWYMLITGFLLLLFLAFYVNCLFDMDLEKKWNVISECGFVIYGLVFTVMALSPPKWVIEILRELVLSQRSGDNESDCVELAGL
ncbi:8465_t:CDS:2 [Ambispora gerdemannii]|uniref:8465_t:CDS:1 n=1 Tax=Ambispora gerdemannii TaxID=144530 RepID=A0A9N9B9B6_9GLOM|nr:8465_t:CDS:2 [Ambispora gerdemannii]